MRVWLALHKPRFGGKTPGRIESVQVIDRAVAHRRRIFALAKRCRNALHYACGNWSDKTFGGAMHMTAEDRDYPVAALQSPRSRDMPSADLKWKRSGPTITSNGG